MNKTRIFSTPDLIKANAVASRHGNRVLADETLDRLDDEGLHVVGFEMIHEKGQFTDIRCLLLMKFEDDEHPHEGVIDLPIDEIDDFSSFVTRNEEGEVVPA